MSALTADASRMHSVNQPQFLPLPVKGGIRIFLNAITCTDPSGFAVPGANTAGLRAQGVAWKPFDNTAGSDGTLGNTFNSFGATRYIEVDSKAAASKAAARWPRLGEMRRPRATAQDDHGAS